MKEEHTYCVHNDEVYLWGTRDSAVIKFDHAYLVYEVWRCTDDNRNIDLLDPSCKGNHCETVDPPCATEQEIDDWIYSKKVFFKFINTKIDFKKYDNETQR